MSGKPVLRAVSLAKRYAHASTGALEDIDLSVDSGSLFGLIGADGAGKSTLLKILATLIPPDAGTATVLGHDIRGDRNAIRTSIGYMPQRFSLYQDLTVLENLVFFADVFGVTGHERARRVTRLLGFAHLEEFTKRRAGNLSGGMKQKLSLCCALVHSPKLIMLDEPTTGVDPVSRNEFWEILKDLVSEGVTMIVSTPYMDETRYCDRLGMLHKGSLLCEGTPAELVADYPLALYRARTPGQLAGFDRTEMPEYIRHAYPSAGDLKVAAAQGADRKDVEQWVKRMLPESGAIERCEPVMEDVFIEKAS
ncbi:MAG: ATP-binding cassette domain-containing protein [Chitinivibrionales bacterium]|nr:ATP-binding cassette domain-containing protein [Chitinivibrionales bacterium]MBD3396559.1 ATP-binding cassette domain-containing protein [Chitinivibrionales bacterium]